METSIAVFKGKEIRKTKKTGMPHRREEKAPAKREKTLNKRPASGSSHVRIT
ncbi:MAG: hypothetical protein KKH04_03110 [Proteobacteria bacterium]|nr:hypothetical protein [Pseudomonadota bacterium]